MISPTHDFDLQKTLADSKLLGLLRLMRGYRWIYLAATLSLGLSALARTGTYLLLRHFVDNVLLENPESLASSVPWIAAAFLGIALVQGAFTYLSGRLAAQTAEGVARRLRNFIFDHLQRLPFRYHDQARTGELIQRSTSDVDAVRRFFADQATGAGRILLLFLVNLAALLALNWQLALLSIIVVPVTVVMSIFFFRRVSAAYEAYQDQDAKLSSTLQENLIGVRVVKAFARQSYEKEKFEGDNWEKFLRGRRLLMMHSFYWPISDILTGAQLLLGFFTGAVMAMDGRISIGTYLAYAGMIVWIIWPIRNLGRLIVQMSTGFVSYGRIVKIIREKREPLDEATHFPQEPPKGELEFSQVSFEYEEGNPVLHDLSLHCRPGQVTALLGPTGSGKSTLVNLLPRFYEYTSGNIFLDGVELNSYPRTFLRQHIGIVEQEPFLFSRTIRENIAYGVGRDVPQEELEHAARAAAIHDVILSFPEGYDTLVGEKGVTLSGGQKQRVAIARTLLKNPRILIMDDSTSSVDTETEAQIRDALDNLMQGRTTFVIAHRIQSLMTADLILVLESGRIVQRGTHDQLVKQDGIYRQIHQMQTQFEVELEKDLAHV
jgi:ATP-binding cassette subfamily B protein